MELNDGLMSSLKDYLKWSKPRLECFVRMLLALLRIQRMNLSRLSLAISDGTAIGSRYRRLQRFFREVHFDYDAIAHLIICLFGFENTRYYLTLDRTNWRWGRHNLNLLTLAIVYKGMAVPIYWLVLNKRGNSNQRERIALLKRFISRFGGGQIKGVLGDREFIGEHWWGWLHEQGIPFVMRMRKNQKYLDKQGRERSVRSLFKRLQVGQSSRLRKPRYISGQAIYLSALRLAEDDWLILAANQPLARPLEVYALRWEIENLFQCLKGRGFNIEDTRLTQYFRIKKMMALLAIGFCWAHKTGEWQAAVIKPLKVKNHGRLEKSLFRYGLDYLADKLTNAKITSREMKRMLRLFIKTPAKMLQYEMLYNSQRRNSS